MSVEHTLALDDEEFPEGVGNPLDAWEDVQELLEVDDGIFEDFEEEQ